MQTKIKFLDQIRKILWASKFWQNLSMELVRGKKSSSLFSRFLPNPYQFEVNKFYKVNSLGITWILEPNQLLEWNMFFSLEESNYSDLMKLIKLGNVIVDVGANFGSTTLIAAQKVGADGQVFAFEPFPSNYKKLIENINQNNFKNINPFQLGLSDKTEYKKMAIKENEHCAQAKVIDSASQLEGIEFLTLDSFVNKYQIKKIHLIKIDVEGFEYHVLKGAKDTLSRLKPIVYFEYSTKLLQIQNSDPQEVINFLKTLDYKIFYASDMKPFDIANISLNYHIDLVARPSVF